MEAASVLEPLPNPRRLYWLQDDSLIYHHHQRGADELPHRGLKEFGSEQLPFQRFAANQAYYYLMVVSFFLFQTFQEDNLQDILPLTSYATTVRRKLIDCAAKIVRTGRQLILNSAASYYGETETRSAVESLSQRFSHSHLVAPQRRIASLESHLEPKCIRRSPSLYPGE